MATVTIVRGVMFKTPWGICSHELINAVILERVPHREWMWFLVLFFLPSCFVLFLFYHGLAQQEDPARHLHLVTELPNSRSVSTSTSCYKLSNLWHCNSSMKQTKTCAGQHNWPYKHLHILLLRTHPVQLIGQNGKCFYNQRNSSAVKQISCCYKMRATDRHRRPWHGITTSIQSQPVTDREDICQGLIFGIS